MISYEERIIIGITNKALTKLHTDRYEFASKFVKDKKVLDIACGTGYGSSLLVKSGAKEIIGIDISEEAISYAQKNYSSPQINFSVGDATKMNSVGDNSIDIIVSFETIEHIKKYEYYLQEMYRVLKKKGVFIISTPNKKFSSPNAAKPLNHYHFIEFFLEDFISILSQHFSSFTIYGQSHNSFFLRFKRKCIKLIPHKIRSFLFSRAFRDNYNLSHISGITENDIGNCEFFIAVCNK